MLKKIFTESTAITLLLILIITQLVLNQANHKENIKVDKDLTEALNKSLSVKKDIASQYKIVNQRYETIIFMLNNK